MHSAIMFLNETGIQINGFKLSVSVPNIAIETPHFRIKLPMTIFKRFAEWYLEDQAIEK